MYQCFLCKYISLNITFLITHLTGTHHLGPNETYKCKQNDCYQTFSNKKSFKKHLTICHKEDVNVNILNTEKSIECSQIFENQTNYPQLNIDNNYNFNFSNEPIKQNNIQEMRDESGN